jgi:hypothetical protein
MTGMSDLKPYTKITRTDDGGPRFEDAELTGRGHVTAAVGEPPFEALFVPAPCPPGLD